MNQLQAGGNTNTFSWLGSKKSNKSTALLLFSLLVFSWVLAATLSGSKPALAFSLAPNLDNGTPNDQSDDLMDAARWSNLYGSLVDDQIRGLGGGLEYSISQEFYNDLIPQFIDDPSVEDLKLAIQQTFDIWALNHPEIRFVNVSGRVNAELPPSSAVEPWRGFGAEIDLVALNSDEYPSVSGVGAWTNFWYTVADPLGTNGHYLPGNTLTSADIIFNTGATYYLDHTQAVDGSNDFTLLLLHEIGHTFGIGHSTNPENGNFDNDHDPFNEMLINYESPLEGLKLSPRADMNSVMNPDLRNHRDDAMTLSEDETGALRFLYPFRSSTATPAN